MESIDDSNSTDDGFGNYSNDNRNSMEGCSNTIDNIPGVSANEGRPKEEISFGTSRKINNQPVSCVPRVSVPEKIILCIENFKDDGADGYTFKDLNENSSEPSAHAIRNEALRVFMVNKLALAKDTEFAVVAVESGKLRKLSTFTSNVNKITMTLREYNKHTIDLGTFIDTIDLTPIFSDELMTVDVPECTNICVTPPDYVVRIIFVYSSSFLVPRINPNDPSYQKFILSPWFFFDVLYLHEKPSDSNNVIKIYNEFGKIVSPNSYLLESPRNVTTVFNSTMKLLAHPNQRVIETVWNF